MAELLKLVTQVHKYVYTHMHTSSSAIVVSVAMGSVQGQINSTLTPISHKIVINSPI